VNLRRSPITVGIVGAILACAACASPKAPADPALHAPRGDAAPVPTSSAIPGAPADQREHDPGSPSPAQDTAPSPCRADAECGYDPTSDQCGSDPRYNRQPPLVDQGIVCYCDESAHACVLLRVAPVPCEGNHVCAVRKDPRPHPVRASGAHPHERGRPCRDFTIKTTCERTNICTMHRLVCR
jgi:hypothetical protein